VADDLWLFDGFNVLHAGPWEDVRELRDALASFVALRGAQGIVVFDGVGDEGTFGPLEVRYAEHADHELERLAADNRAKRAVTLVSSDNVVRGTAGQGGVRWVTSQNFLLELGPTTSEAELEPERPRGLGGRLDPATAERLERLRRGES
jgi:predicted RNA-binding protein with PIN domain